MTNNIYRCVLKKQEGLNFGKEMIMFESDNFEATKDYFEDWTNRVRNNNSSYFYFFDQFEDIFKDFLESNNDTPEELTLQKMYDYYKDIEDGVGVLACLTQDTSSFLLICE